MRRPIRTPHQMWFVDVGLMPAVEQRLGATLHHLVEMVIQNLAESLGGQLSTKKISPTYIRPSSGCLPQSCCTRRVSITSRRISLTDVDEVFSRVGKHYADLEDLPPGGKAPRPAIAAAATAVAGWGYLGNLSAEWIAHLYETALRSIRSQRGEEPRKPPAYMISARS